MISLQGHRSGQTTCFANRLWIFAAVRGILRLSLTAPVYEQLKHPSPKAHVSNHNRSGFPYKAKRAGEDSFFSILSRKSCLADNISTRCQRVRNTSITLFDNRVWNDGTVRPVRDTWTARHRIRWKTIVFADAGATVRKPYDDELFTKGDHANPLKGGGRWNNKSRKFPVLFTRTTQ